VDQSIKSGQCLPVYLSIRLVRLHFITILLIMGVFVAVPVWAQMPKHLEQNTEFEVQGRSVAFAVRTDVGFYSNGDVLYGTLAEDTLLTVQGKEVWFKKYSRIVFHVGGSFHESDGLQGDTVFQIQGKDVLFTAGQFVGFFSDGRMKSGTPAEIVAFMVQGKAVKFKPGHMMFFTEDGTPTAGALAEDTLLQVGGQAVLFKAGGEPGSPTGIQFHENGELNYGILAEDTDLAVMDRIIRLKQDTQIAFYPNGMVIQGTLAEEMVIEVQGKKVRFKAAGFPGWPDFHFFRNGVLSEGTLAEDVELDYHGEPVTLLEGFYLRFDEQGNLIEFSS